MLFAGHGLICCAQMLHLLVQCYWMHDVSHPSELWHLIAWHFLVFPFCFSLHPELRCASKFVQGEIGQIKGGPQPMWSSSSRALLCVKELKLTDFAGRDTPVLKQVIVQALQH